jgi:hypothetical protein
MSRGSKARPQDSKTAYQQVLDDYWSDYLSRLSRDFGYKRPAQPAPDAPVELFDDATKDGTEGKPK